jgi:hypothetical protein
MSDYKGFLIEILGSLFVLCQGQVAVVLGVRWQLCWGSGGSCAGGQVARFPTPPWYFKQAPATRTSATYSVAPLNVYY